VFVSPSLSYYSEVYLQLLLTSLRSDIEQAVPELVIATRGSLYDLILGLLDGRCLFGLWSLVGGGGPAGCHCEYRRRLIGFRN
jgi:hypothetical protein